MILYYILFTLTPESLAICNVPSSRPKVLKHWWNSDASTFKNNALKSFNIWKDTGRKPNGTEFDEMKKCKKSINATSLN